MVEGSILVDSSVWIEGIAPREAASLRQVLRALLESERALVTDMVRLEVIGGARSAVEFEKSRADFEAIPCLKTTPNIWHRAEEINFILNRKGQKASAADTLIAAVAVSQRVPLWHSDSDFERIKSAVPELKTYWYPKQIPAL